MIVAGIKTWVGIFQVGDFLDGNFPGGNFPDGSFRDTLFYISFESVKITFKCKTLKFYQGSLNRVLHHLVYGSNYEHFKSKRFDHIRVETF